MFVIPSSFRTRARVSACARFFHPGTGRGTGTGTFENEDGSMLLIALRMLVGNKASCIGVIFGIFLATLLISQQSAIFLGLIERSYRLVTDIPTPDIWVMDPATSSDDELRAMPRSYLDIVRSTKGVEWAMPLSLAHLPVTNRSGVFEIANVMGVDDATLSGAPLHLIEGKPEDLRRESGVIIDVDGAKDLLAYLEPDGKKRPLKIGDLIEVNHVQAAIVGIAKITEGFYPRPSIYTTNSQLVQFAPNMQNMLSFIMVKAQKGETSNVIKAINRSGRMEALTKKGFEDRIVNSFLETGILINFGLSVALGIIIGFSIAGQIFYIITLGNLKYYALIRALGGTQKMLFQMITVQTFVVGIIGFLIGIGTTVLWEFAVRETTLAFLFNWQLLLFTALLIFLICIFTAGMSIHKVLKVDPVEVLGT